MEIKVESNASDAAKLLARILAQKIRQQPDMTIGFPTGRTMDAVYFHLAEQHREESIDFSQVKAFLLDEYIGLPRGHKNLFQEYLKIHLFDQFNFQKENIFFPDVFSSDHDEAARDFEKKIRDVGGLDIILLGVGKNGHIAFNEPGSAVDSRTRVVALTSSTLRANSFAFKPDMPPLTAISMGIGTIMEAKECYLIATGESKAEVIVRLVNGDVNSQMPATALKTHKNFTLILDNESSKSI